MKNFLSILICASLLFNYSYAELDDLDTNEPIVEEIVTTEEIPIEDTFVVEEIIEEIIEEEQQIIEEEENIVEELPQEIVEENEPEEPITEEKQEVESISEEKPEVEEPILEEQEFIPEENIVEESIVEETEPIVVEEPIPEEVTIEEEEEPFIIEIPEPYCYITSSIGEDETVYSGQEITFTLHLVNFTGNYTINWQYSEDEMNFNNIENEHGETYSFIITRANAHYAYRAIVEVEE